MAGIIQHNIEQVGALVHKRHLMKSKKKKAVSAKTRKREAMINRLISERAKMGPIDVVDGNCFHMNWGSNA